MLRSKYKFSLDIKLTQSQVSIPVMLNDTVWGFYINLIDDGKPFFIPDGCRAVFVAKKPDGNTLFNDCIIEKNNIVRYDFTANTTNVEGTVPCEIRVYGPAGRMLTCPRFTMVVDHRVLLDDEVIFSESEKTTLDSIILSENARQQAELARAAAEVERAAVAANAAEAVRLAGEAVQKAEDAVLRGVTHSWEGTVLTVTSTSGTSSADLKGDPGKDGIDGKDGRDGTDGKDGVDGKDGEDGKTPIYGTDYFTEAEKNAFVNEVLNSLQRAEEVSV